MNPAQAFPPYKSTDADTADPKVLQLRLGLVQIEREAGETGYLSPLLRMNLGLPEQMELVTELEYLPEEGNFGAGAAGFKWAPIQAALSLGIETLALLPVRPGDDGVGIEPQVVATWQETGSEVQLHINAGGFHDPRGRETENGWRASALAEMTRGTFRPGIELFARQATGQETEVRLGFGMIKSFGALELRSAAHVGITDRAPDFVFNLWISMEFPFE